jgi:hypothetical protein
MFRVASNVGEKGIMHAETNANVDTTVQTVSLVILY